MTIKKVVSAAAKPVPTDEATDPQSRAVVMQVVYDEVYDFGRQDRLGGRKHSAGRAGR
jgi:hypothetical protein